MNKYLNLFGLSVVLFSIQVFAATTWDLDNNRVTYSVFQDNFQLGSKITKSVALSQLNLSEVAVQEGLGTAVNYTLTSVVLSMNGTVYGTIYLKNNSASTVEPTFMVMGSSKLSFGSSSTPSEYYNQEVPIGTISAGQEYSENVTIVGLASPSSVNITQDLAQFLGTGTIETLGTFPVNGFFDSAGTDYNAVISLQGKADIAVTYNYEYSAVPEPTSMALVALGCAALALRRKRVITA